MWNMQLERMGIKSKKSAGFNSVGCNALGFDVMTTLRIFQCFVRPIANIALRFARQNEQLKRTIFKGVEATELLADLIKPSDDWNVWRNQTSPCETFSLRYK